jgi:Leucine-rich repeat (LRR) protein
LETLFNYLTLDISNNQLTGPIPFELLSLPQLTLVDLSHNLLSGFELRNETQLTSPVVGENQLTRLDLSANKLRGQIPNSVFNLKNLETLDLSNNYLTGIVEFDEFVTLKNLTTLDISGNQLSEFPNFLRNQHELEYLNLSNNTIHGHVPEWMWNTSTTSLKFLDLSNNLLTGFSQHPIFLPWTSLQVS